MANKTKLKAPSGLGIKRNGNRFTFSWNKGDSGYTDQNLKWRENSEDFTTLKDSKVGKNTNKKTVSIDLKDYYPNTTIKQVGHRKDQYGRLIPIYMKVDCPKLESIRFGVQGEEQSSKTGNKLLKSEWTYKSFSVKPALKPKVSATLSTEYSNVTKFSWNIDYGKSNASESPHMFLRYEYYTVLKTDSNVSDGSKIKNWTNSSKNTKGSHEETTAASKTIAEDVPLNDGHSYTRYIRVRAIGPGGNSAWAYAQHVYASPNRAKKVSASAVSDRSGYRVKVTWTVDTSYDRPVDSVVVQYAIAVPASSHTDDAKNSVRKVSLLVPEISDGDWHDAPGGVVKDTKSTDGVTFTIGESIPPNACVYVRVNTKHDTRTTYGTPVFVEKAYGTLSDPTDLATSNVTPDYLATITLTNNCSITESIVGIYFKTSTNQTPRLVGIWPAGQSSAITVQLPNPGTAAEYSLGAQAFVANYSPITAKLSGVTEYGLSNIQMKSSGIIWDSRPVPQAPVIKSLTSPRTGVARLIWDWKWTAANGVEISWADHDDAWESTDEPSTYVLENTRATAWNVAGLDVGTWYFRVRLFKTDGEAVTYGTYSNMEEIRIAASPTTPVLTISPNIISPGDTINCYWVYSAVEGDEQIQAHICEAIIGDGGNVTYGQIISKANDEQFKNVAIPDGWASGETHNLAVRIITANGETASENWSVPKPVTILEPVVASITSTSLIEKSRSIDDVEEETETVLSLTDMPLQITGAGADSGGKMTYVIERYGDSFHADRPDENDIYGFNEETVAIIEKLANNSYELTTDTTVNSATTYYTRSGTDPDYIYTEVQPPEGANPSALGYYVLTGFDFTTTVTNDDLLIHFDDGAWYNIIAIAEDSYGQVSEPVNLHFVVNWDHQAVMPVADISVDNEETVAFITPRAPEYYYQGIDAEIVEGRTYYTFSSVAIPTIDDLASYYELDDGVMGITGDDEIVAGKTYYTVSEVPNPSQSAVSTYYTKPFPGDSCDIYRLSADKPELIIPNATFGTRYVDPYPTLGSMGGHRIVYKTVNGDYITKNNEYAWTDYLEDDGDIVDVFATIIDFGGDKAVLPYDLSLSTQWKKDFIETKYLGGAVQGDWNKSVSRSGSVKTRVAVKHDSELIEVMRRLAVYAGVCHVRTPDGSSYSANVDVTEDREERKINMLASFSLSITRVDSEGFDGMTYNAWIGE